MIYSCSKKPDQKNKNYSTKDKELQSVVKSLQHFIHYVAGQRDFELDQITER